MSIRDSARWCAACQSHGDHHTDRHQQAMDAENAAREDALDDLIAEKSRTFTYSQINPGGADVTHGLTFIGTDTEWSEHLAQLTHQGIEVYNARTAHSG
jgi:hypothetical protein